jgi:cytochrome P450
MSSSNTADRTLRCGLGPSTLCPSAPLPLCPSALPFARLRLAFTHSVTPSLRHSQAGRERNDLISHFLNAARKEGTDYTDQQMRDTILNFMIAGQQLSAPARPLPPRL